MLARVCSTYYTLGMANQYGKFVRARRLELSQRGPQYSVRRVAGNIGITPSFLSKVERGELPPPSEATIKKLAVILEVNPDVMLALAGKVSSDLREVILKRPQLVAELIRLVKNAPDKAVLRVVREVRDGKW